jgi:hypothetical protein
VSCQFFLPHTLQSSPDFDNRFIRIDEFGSTGIDFSNPPLDLVGPGFFDLSLRGRNESRELMRETNSLPFGEPHLRSPDAFVRDNHASDATSERA